MWIQESIGDPACTSGRTPKSQPISFEHASNDERDGQSDQENRDTHQQRDPGRPKQRHECLEECSLPTSGPGHVDDICHRADVVSHPRQASRRQRGVSRTVAETIPGFHDGGSLAGNESARTSSSARSAASRACRSLDLVNDPVDSYDRRHDRRDVPSRYSIAVLV